MPRRFQVTVDGHTYEVEVSELTDTRSAAAPVVNPAPAAESMARAALAPAKMETKASAIGGTVAAPLPGVALEVKVAVGDRVSLGDVLVILEAMKMENEIAAPTAGVVRTVHVVPGASVASGDPLVTLG
ncbi:MAG: biotin/lipoyl-binding protein [Thermaerobacter sp.]|nr:biotin/lipoyl-binding protein [Thermaerobacter sp.]